MSSENDGIFVTKENWKLEICSHWREIGWYDGNSSIVKDRNPHSLEELCVAIERDIRHISCEELQKVFENFHRHRHLHICLTDEECYFQQLPHIDQLRTGWRTGSSQPILSLFMYKTICIKCQKNEFGKRINGHILFLFELYY